MIVYLDTSAWVKLFVEESGSDQIRKILGDCDAVCTHLITYAEIHAAFAKAHRMNRVSDNTLQIILNNFEDAWQHTMIIAADEPLVRRAALLALVYHLRGYDSLHLAAAEQVQKNAPAALTFACFDQRLNDAAKSLGITVL